MIKLSQKTEENIIQEIRWRFSLTDAEIKDCLEKTVQYLNTIQETLHIENDKQLESIVEKLIKIS